MSFKINLNCMYSEATHTSKHVCSLILMDRTAVGNRCGWATMLSHFSTCGCQHEPARELLICNQNTLREASCCCLMQHVHMAENQLRGELFPLFTWWGWLQEVVAHLGHISLLLLLGEKWKMVFCVRAEAVSSHNKTTLGNWVNQG